jgi:CRP-like cAMP-binding protein
LATPEIGVALRGLTEGMTDVEQAALAKVMSVHRFSSGDRLVEQGEWHDALLILGAGKAAVRLGSRSAPVELETIGPGDWIGEMEVLEPGPAPMSIEALEDGWLLQLPNEELEHLRLVHPDLSTKLHLRLSGSLARRLRDCNAGGLESRPSGPGLGDWLRSLVTGKAIQ